MSDLVSDIVRRIGRSTEQYWLRRWHLASRMRGVKLDLRLDFATTPGRVRATADFTFKSQVRNTTTCCILGNVDLQSVGWQGRQVKARVNSPFLVLSFPRPLGVNEEATVQVRYMYAPDQYGTILQPSTKDDFATRVWITCRRPLLGVVQGRLVQGAENPPLVTYQWQPPRCRRLNAVVADVRSFRKEVPDGPSIWLHLQKDWAVYAPRVLDVLVELYRESHDAHHRKLPYQDFHVVESDDPHVMPFNSPGLIVVPKGTFNTDSRPTIYGILATEMNKEWRRDPTRMVSEGAKD